MTYKRIECSYENGGDPDLGFLVLSTGELAQVNHKTKIFTMTVEEAVLEKVQKAILKFGYEIKQIVDQHY